MLWPGVPVRPKDETNPRAAGRGMVLVWRTLTCSPPLQGGAGGGSNRTELARCSE